jgi:hypothetical protein
MKYTLKLEKLCSCADQLHFILHDFAAYFYSSQGIFYAKKKSASHYVDLVLQYVSLFKIITALNFYTYINYPEEVCSMRSSNANPLPSVIINLDFETSSAFIYVYYRFLYLLT